MHEWSASVSAVLRKPAVVTWPRVVEQKASQDRWEDGCRKTPRWLLFPKLICFSPHPTTDSWAQQTNLPWVDARLCDIGLLT